MNAFATVLLMVSAGLPIGAVSLRPLDDRKVKIEFRQAEYDKAEGLIETKDPSDNQNVYLHKIAELTNSDIAEVRKGADGAGKPALAIKFTKEGAKKMEKLTSKDRMRKPLAILIDGKLLMAPRINAQLSDKCIIDANYTDAQLDELVKKFTGK